MNGGSLPVQRKSVFQSVLDAAAGLARETSPRARRVMILAMMILVLSSLDLGLTMQAQRLGGFHEANPIARPFVGSEGDLIVFKAMLTLPALVVFLALRRRRLTEIGCWLLLAAHIVLISIWVSYYLLL